VNRLASHPTLPLLIAAYEDKTVRLFDLKTGMLSFPDRRDFKADRELCRALHALLCRAYSAYNVLRCRPIRPHTPDWLARRQLAVLGCPRIKLSKWGARLRVRRQRVYPRDLRRTSSERRRRRLGSQIPSDTTVCWKCGRRWKHESVRLRYFNNERQALVYPSSALLPR